MTNELRDLAQEFAIFWGAKVKSGSQVGNGCAHLAEEAEFRATLFKLLERVYSEGAKSK